MIAGVREKEKADGSWLMTGADAAERRAFPGVCVPLLARDGECDATLTMLLNGMIASEEESVTCEKEELGSTITFLL